MSSIGGIIGVMRAITVFFGKISGKKAPAGIAVNPFQGSRFEGLWVTPEGYSGERIILYFPGGGFVARTPLAHRNLLIKLCRTVKARGLLVLYSLAPEHPFPAGFEDCVEAYKKLLAEGRSPGSIILAGDSAGGNMVLSTLMYLRDNQLPLPACGIMLSPLLDLTFTGESRQTNARSEAMLPNGGKKHIEKIYHPGTPDNHPYVSPVFGDFTGLPPLLGQVGSTEILRDDTVRAAENARKANVPFTLEVWPGLPHVWQLMDFMPESSEAIAHIKAFIHSHCPDAQGP